MLGIIPNLKHQNIGNVNDASSSVDIYVLPDCPWSKRALEILDSNGIIYKYYLISSDEEFVKIRNRTSFNTFPQIFINNKFIVGYSELVDLSENGNLNTLLN